jgi:hypothetical protein
MVRQHVANRMANSDGLYIFDYTDFQVLRTPLQNWSKSKFDFPTKQNTEAQLQAERATQKRDARDRSKTIDISLYVAANRSVPAAFQRAICVEDICGEGPRMLSMYF